MVIYFSLFLSLGVLGSYSAFQNHFYENSPYKTQVEVLQKELGEARTQAAIFEYELKKYQQEVATLLPTLKPAVKQTYLFRKLASITYQGQEENLNIKFKATTLFTNAKIKFTAKKYKESAKMFQLYIESYSFATEVIEAYYLLSESYVQLKEWNEAIKVVQKMVNLFPANEMTGLAMVRMGKIYERQSRANEAIEIYRLVMKTFPYRGLAENARDALRDVGL